MRPQSRGRSRGTRRSRSQPYLREKPAYGKYTAVLTAQLLPGYNMLMRRLMSTALTLLLLAAPAAAQPDPSGSDALRNGVTRLERAEYTEALHDFEKALDGYAAAHRLEDVK